MSPDLEALVQEAIDVYDNSKDKRIGILRLIMSVLGSMNLGNDIGQTVKFALKETIAALYELGEENEAMKYISLSLEEEVNG